MKLGIRLKLFLVSIALIAVSVVAADAYLTRTTERQVTDALREDLFVRASLVAREAAAARSARDDRGAWKELADALGRAAAGRVTLIARDGAVLGDSEVELAAVAAVENHAAREEVARALAGGRGET